MKEVKKETSKNFYLYITQKIKEGKNPALIAKDLEFTKQRLNYYLSTLKRHGCIKKIGYAVWDFVKEFNPKEVKKSVVIGINSRHSLNKGLVRGHGFMIKLQLPNNLKNWKNREELFNKINKEYEDYYVGGIKRGQRILFNNYKVSLTDKSIIINLPESFIRENSIQAKKDAIFRFMKIIKGLERELRANFSQFGKYRFRVSRQHYALIKNSLAKQYDDEDRKLYVYADRGLWLIVDNSYNLHELETLHPKTADRDSLNVQNFFNSIDRDPITSTEIKSNFKEIKEILKESSRSQLMTSEVISQLDKNVQKITGEIIKIKKGGVE